MRLNYYFRSIETSPSDQHQFIASRVPPDNCPANWEFMCGEDVYDQALDALERKLTGTSPPDHTRMYDVTSSIEHIRLKMKSALVAGGYAAETDDFAVDAYTHAYYDGACVATFMNVSLNEAQQVVLEANRQRVAAPYYLRPGQAMENQHVVKFGAAPLDNKLFFSMETPAQAERRYMASVVHPDYCVSINT